MMFDATVADATKAIATNDNNNDYNAAPDDVVDNNSNNICYLQ